MPEVDIIMPNYNKSQYIDEAIKSVLKQNFIDWNLQSDIEACMLDLQNNTMQKINK